jgi:antitoxin component of MazEF toxin-antitoxin module
MTKSTWEFAADDIFKDIDGDSENINMTIPEEILKEKGWGPGTELKISWSDGQIILEEVTKEVDGKE